MSKLKILKIKLATKENQSSIIELSKEENCMGDEEFEGEVMRLDEELRKQWIDFWIDATTKARRQFLKQFIKKTSIKV